MPMPTVKAPISNDGPIGATAPPKFGTDAATGTTITAATAMTMRPPASPRVRKSRQDAV